MAGVAVKCICVAVAQRGDIHRLVAALLQIVDDREERAHGDSVDGDNLVAKLNSGFGGGHVGFELGDGDGLVLHPSDGAVLVGIAARRLRIDLLFENLVAALNGDV